MSVSHLASSESHTGTTGSTTAVPFTWNHTPGGTPRGVTVFVWTNNAVGTLATGVTYQGVTVPAVVNGEVIRTASETGSMKVYHLGSGIPTASPAEVIVSRTGTNSMWACCVTQAAGTDTEITGIFKVQSGLQEVFERNVDDGSPGSNSLRYGASHFGHDTLPPAGANSTTVASMQIDIGGTCAEVVVETAPGQGSRPVGMVTAVIEDQAGIYVAVREVVGVAHLASSESHVNNIGSLSEGSFTWDHAHGGVARGVLVFVWMNTEFSVAETVTYAGMALPAVENGFVHRVSGEEGTVQSFFLGANIPATDPAPVIVTRQNTGDRLWACCITVAAVHNTEVYTPGITKNSTSASLVEATVDDGSPGTNSVRYAAGHFAYDTAPTAGANSTLLQDFDPSVLTASAVVETVPGQGARPVGWVDAREEEKAVIYLALREIVPTGPEVGADLNVIVYGYAWPQSPIEGVAPSLARMLTIETLHLADLTPPSVIRSAPSQVTFTASPDHASVTGYTAVLYPYPDAVPPVSAGSLSLGVPTPDGTNTITADLAPLYAGKPAGDYYIIIVTTTPSGTAPSEPSNVFTLPLV